MSDFFSGANAAVDLTMEPDYAGIVDFNETELWQYFGGFIKDVAKAKGISTTEILSEMKKWHDGFQFTAKNESLYSPVSVIGYLRSKSDVQSWSDTGRPSQFLVNSLKEFPADALKISVDDESEERRNLLRVHRQDITGKVNFQSLTDSTALVALLFHNGYQSISDYDSVTQLFTLEFSNFELKKDYVERLYTSYTNAASGTLVKLMNSLMQDLAKRQFESFIGKLNIFNAQIPYEISEISGRVSKLGSNLRCS